MKYLKINKNYGNKKIDSNKNLKNKINNYYWKNYNQQLIIKNKIQENKTKKLNNDNENLQNFINNIKIINYNKNKENKINNNKNINNNNNVNKTNNYTVPKSRLPIIRNTYIIKKKIMNIKSNKNNLIENENNLNENINYNEMNMDINQDFDYLKLLFYNKNNLNLFKKETLVLQFEGILGEFFYNIKFSKLNENKKKLKIKKDCFCIINNLIKFIINLNRNNSVFLIVNKNTYINENFQNNIFNKIKFYICGIFELVQVNNKSLYLNTNIFKKIILNSETKIKFIFSLNYDYNKKKQLDYHKLKKQCFRLIDEEIIESIVYIKNLLFSNNKNYVKINDNFYKINNNYYFKLNNLLIKKDTKELNNLIINQNLGKKINEYELNNIENYIHYQKCYSNILKDFKYEKKPKLSLEDLEKEIFNKKTKFLKIINELITNQRNAVYYDFINRNSYLMKKYINNTSNKVKNIKDHIKNNKKINYKIIEEENLEIKNIIKNCYYLI